MIRLRTFAKPSHGGRFRMQQVKHSARTRGGHDTSCLVVLIDPVLAANTSGSHPGYSNQQPHTTSYPTTGSETRSSSTLVSSTHGSSDTRSMRQGLTIWARGSGRGSGFRAAGE